MVFGPTVRQILPYVNFCIASGALVFQMCVLYPWHKRLDEDFYILKDEQNEKLKQYHTVKLETLNAIENDIMEVKSQQLKIHEDIKELNGKKR